MAKISMFASMTEVRKFVNENGYSFHDVNLAQIYALYQLAGWTRAMIANHLDYAPSTVSTKRHYMWDYAELANLLFGENIVEVEEETPIQPIKPETLYRKFRDGRSVAMEFMPNFGENLSNEQMVYFFKFFGVEGLLFDKIGTTAKNAVSRLRDEIGEYSKKFPIDRVEIHRIRSCCGIPAEGYESELRARLIADHPTAFRKNDRFFGADISASVFDDICDAYFSSMQN
jgi:hypothetical protein